MLTLKLTVGALSQDGTSFSLQDTTGLYNVTTNPGGYGVPNETSGDSLLAIIKYSLFGEKSNQVNLTAAALIAGITFNAFLLGLTTDENQAYLIPDGVNTFEYLVGYGVVGNYSIDLKTIDTTGMTIPAGITHVSFGSTQETTYKIARIETNSIILYDYPVVADGDILVVFYSTTSYLLVDTYINRLIDKQIIAMNPCDDSDSELIEDMMNVLAASSRFEQKDYLGANTLITELNRRYEYAYRRV